MLRSRVTSGSASVRAAATNQGVERIAGEAQLVGEIHLRRRPNARLAVAWKSRACVSATAPGRSATTA
jgi:hypothetical protein